MINDRVRTEERKSFQVVASEFESFPDSGGHSKEIILADFPFPASKFALQGRRVEPFPALI